jgi:hypothetical protein
MQTLTLSLSRFAGEGTRLEIERDRVRVPQAFINL